MCIFWTSWDGRTALGILLFAAFLRGWYATREGKLQPIPFACASAVAIAVAFYYSADTGVYGIAAWGLTLGAVAWEHRRESHKIRLAITAGAAFAASAAVLLFVINLINGGLLDFHFWRTSLALVSVHRWNEPAAMSDSGELHLLAPLVVGTALFVLRPLVPAERSRVIVARIGFLLSAFVFAVLSMQSGLVRSDFPHIIAGVYPLAFFSGVILFSFRSTVGSVVAAIGAVAASLLFVHPLPEFQPASLRFRLARMVHPITSYRIKIGDRVVVACCPRCGMRAQVNRERWKGGLAWATDVNTGERVAAESAVYVEGGDVQYCTRGNQPMVREPHGASTREYDRCLPTLVAFKTPQDARAYQQQHGGRVLSYAQALASVGEQ